jgi:hypothetical protein
MKTNNHNGTAHRTLSDIDRLKNARLRLHLPSQRARDELKAMQEELTAAANDSNDESSGSRAA